MAEKSARGLDRLELRIERLQLVFRFTYAFHAREVRFETDDGEGFTRIFPETFSFRLDRHDPTELLLQLDDLSNKPHLLSPRASPRDARRLTVRLVAEVPRHLDRMRARLSELDSLPEATRLKVHEDLALLSQVFLRFIEMRELESERQIRMAGFTLRKLRYRCLLEVMHQRVSSDYLSGYVHGEVDPVDPADDPSESGFFHVVPLFRLLFQQSISVFNTDICPTFFG